MKILHISTHLGGGAGKAIVGMSKILLQNCSDVQIKIFLLEKPIQKEFTLYAEQLGIEVIIVPDKEQIKRLCKNCDIIVLNWWAHPKMYALLHFLDGEKMRIILWVHFNGCLFPNISPKFIDCFEHTFFTCKYSYENPEWSENTKRKILDKSSIVYGIGDFKPQEIQEKDNFKISDDIFVGYLGTVNYNKMNKKYLWACQEIKKRLPNVKFLLYGSSSKEIQDEIEKNNMKEYVILKGYANNANEELLKCDIFAYPLNLWTSGTTENVLLEAMAMALPIVVLNQGTEKNIIKDNVTGICANDMNDYVVQIVQLCTDENLRKKLGKNARKEVIETYDSYKNTKLFYNKLKELEKSKKKYFKIKPVIGNTGFEFFLSSAGKYKEIFKEILKKEEYVLSSVELPDTLFSESKGSLIQFLSVYSKDKELMKLRDRLSNEIKNICFLEGK